MNRHAVSAQLVFLSIVGSVIASESACSEAGTSTNTPANSGGSLHDGAPWDTSGGASPWPTPDGGDDGSVGGTGGTGGEPLSCDSRFSFSQSPPRSGVPFDVRFTDTPGYTYVDMQVSGPGSPAMTWVGVTGSGPYTWTWGVQGHGAGVLTFRFVKDTNTPPGVEVARCQVEAIAGTGGTGGSGGAGGSGGSGGTAGGGGAPPANRYGIGYVNEGNAADHDLTARLAGPGGWVLLIFADVRPDRHAAEASWKQSVADAYARDLIPVIRMAPPWGDRRVRNMGESPTSYKALGAAYRDIIADLPRRAGWPLYVHVHNEPNLCYEWQCDAGSGWLDETTLASEYAHMLADVADAIHSLGDPLVKVTNGALAPGSVLACECAYPNDGGYQGGTTALTYLAKMKAAVPDVFNKIDVFASHSYPSEGEGWGFFCDYDAAMPGLKFFEKELQAIGKPAMEVIISETGWATEGDGHSWSRDQIAQFTVKAYQNVWLTHPNILGVTPFMLRDPAWDRFAWVDGASQPYPVYTAVRSYRCSQPGASNCQ